MRPLATPVAVAVMRRQWVNLHLEGEQLLNQRWRESRASSETKSPGLHEGRGTGDGNLSPLMLGPAINSPAPALDVGRRFRLLTNVTHPDVPPNPTESQRVLDGLIDNIDVAGPDDTVVLQIRDRGGLLLNRVIEDSVAYSTLGGTPVETVMQQILTAGASALPPLGVSVPTLSLVTPVSPGWDIKQFNQQQMPMLEALRKLALQIGWDLRYRNVGGDEAPQLYFLDPDRTKTRPDLTLGPTEYFDVRDLTLIGDDIRNVVRGWYGNRLTYQSSSTTDAALAGRLTSSIQKYGRRFMQVVEDSSSNVDTLEEITRMVDAAASDLCEPFASQEVSLRYFWPVQLNDLIRFQANGVHYDTDQDWSVVSYQHSLGAEESTTTIRTRGKPIAAYHDWMRGKPRRVHVATEPPPIGPDAEEGALWLPVDSVLFP